MSHNVFKLDDLIRAADEAYANFPVDLGDGQEPVILRNVLQMTEDERKAISEAAGDDEGEGPESAEDVPEAERPTVMARLREQIRLVADKPEGADRLIEKIGDNLAHLMYGIREYNRVTQLGEASTSDG